MTNTHLWLAVPLKIDEKIIGVIALQSYDNARLYSEKDIDLLEFVSQQLSAAIYKKKLKAKIINMEQEDKDKDKIYLDSNKQSVEKSTSPLSKENNENISRINENAKDN
jgi:GAF domain-containing protein